MLMERVIVGRLVMGRVGVGRVVVGVGRGEVEWVAVGSLVM